MMMFKASSTGKSLSSADVAKAKKMTPIQLYKAKNDYMTRYYGPDLPAEKFYSEIFPLDTIERMGDKSFTASNPIFTYMVKKENGNLIHRNMIVFADHFAESVQLTKKNDFALCSMISYYGRNKTMRNGHLCHGFIIDLDGVGMEELHCFWGWVEDLKHIPYPTYVANSGHGLHIYYLFQNPVPLYPKVAKCLNKLKEGLTEWVWNKETSNYNIKDRQYQNIYQSFRMVGSCTKLGKGNARYRYPVKVWRTGKPVSISYLNSFVSEEFKAPEDPDYASWDFVYEREGHHSLAECEKLYPEWYKRRIIERMEPGHWVLSRKVYDWWLRLIKEKAHDGNRYYCIGFLYVYAMKCGIPKETVDADAMSLLEKFDEMTQHADNAFTIKDIQAAAKLYDPKYIRISKIDISRKTGIRIESNSRRNYRNRADHLARARLIRTLSGYDNAGRPNGSGTKRVIVAEWRASHPDGLKIECERETGLSRPTILKWWDAVEPKDE